MNVTVYTDGAYKRKREVGGWGFTMWRDEQPDSPRIERFGGAKDTTNQRMELQAAIEALGVLNLGSFTVTLISDSKYVVDGMNSWMHGWVKKGWKNSTGNEVKNLDLWLELYDNVCLKNLKVVARWVKGHSGDVNNDRADELANLGVDAIVEARKLS